MWLRITAVFLVAGAGLLAEDSATLGLVIRKGATVSAVVRESFEADTALGVQSSFRDAKWVLVWRDEGSSSASESYDRLIVVAFKGDCSTVMPKSAYGNGPLGWTSTSGDRVLPFIGIDCDRVKAALMAPEGWPHSIIPSGLLARALSHVALHEIYHVLSERKHHDAEGLFKAEYSPSDLLAPVAMRPAGLAEIAGLPKR